MNGMVDLLVFNPPYVCTPDEEVSMHGISAAWAGGHRGRRVIDRMLPCVDELLSPDGELVMIALDENDPQGNLFFYFFIIIFLFFIILELFYVLIICTYPLQN
jgi:methylase of polypeptide subunit release factors